MEEISSRGDAEKNDWGRGDVSKNLQLEMVCLRKFLLGYRYSESVLLYASVLNLSSNLNISY